MDTNIVDLVRNAKPGDKFGCIVRDEKGNIRHGSDYPDFIDYLRTEKNESVEDVFVFNFHGRLFDSEVKYNAENLHYFVAPNICNIPVVMLKHNFKDISWNSQFYAEQCPDLQERYIIDVTSRNPDKTFSRQLSPMFIGPVTNTGTDKPAKCFELFWQCSKVYPIHFDYNRNEPNEAFWRWRDYWFSKEIDEVSVPDKRHPNKELGCKPKDCVCSMHFDTVSNTWQKLGYVDSRKKVYVPEYAKLIAETDAFKQIKNLVDQGKKIALVDFDAYNFYKEGLSMYGCINDATKPFGHGYVIKMLLDGDISVVNGKVIDNKGFLK